MQKIRRRPELLVAALGLVLAAALLLWVGLADQTQPQSVGVTVTQDAGAPEDPFAAPQTADGASAGAQGDGGTPQDPFAVPESAGSTANSPEGGSVTADAQPGSAGEVRTEAQTYATKNPHPAVVNLNSATLDQLQTLPGIGPVKAQAILDYRDAHGRFTDVTQLLEIKGIGEATLAKLLPYVTV